MTGMTCELLCAPQILTQLDQCKQFPDFNNYLAFIFAHGEGLPVEVRPPNHLHLPTLCPCPAHPPPLALDSVRARVVGRWLGSRWWQGLGSLLGPGTVAVG